MMRQLLAISLIAVVVSGCSGGGGTPTALPSTSPLAPTGSSQSIPDRTGPEIDLSVFGRDACKTLTKQQLRDNNNVSSGEQIAAPDGVECKWRGDFENTSIYVKLMLDLEGLKTVYDTKKGFPYFKPVTVGPFRGVHFDTIPDVSKGQCSSAVGTGVKTAVITTVYLRIDDPERTKPCQVADRVALLVVGNAQAQGGK